MYLDRPIASRPPSPHTHLDPFTDSPPRTPPPQGESYDVARLRRTHTTQGYRDGITSGKAAHLQDGFDEGYSLGGRFGLKIGWLLGVVEGLWFVAREDERMQRLRREAEVELTLERVFGREYFDEGGVWTYDVGEEEGVTLDRVVERHPVVEKWVGRVVEEAGRWGLVVGELGHEGEGHEGEGHEGEGHEGEGHEGEEGHEGREG